MTIYSDGLADGVKFIYNEEEAKNTERSWARFAGWVRDNPVKYPNGYHHQGIYWVDIYYIVSPSLYKTGIVRVAHKKLTNKNIECLRKETLPGGHVRWVLSYHWEGRCPACQKPSLIRRNGPKLIRRSAPKNPDDRPKLIRRGKP